ncbi:unnamed protein product [Brassica oleracea var. botrytis]
MVNSVELGQPEVDRYIELLLRPLPSEEETRKHEIQHEINRLLDEMLSLENRHHWRRRKL